MNRDKRAFCRLFKGRDPHSMRPNFLLIFPTATGGSQTACGKLATPTPPKSDSRQDTSPREVSPSADVLGDLGVFESLG